MPSQSGCRGTVKKDTVEILGITEWSYEEAAETGGYVDNTTNCVEAPLTGAVTPSGSASANLQITTGPPLRAGDEVELELHVDDTGQNYITGTAIITRLGLTVSIENAQEVPSYDFDYRFTALPTFNGSLEPPV